MKVLIRFCFRGIRSLTRKITKYLVILQIQNVGENFICDQNVIIYNGQNISIGNNVTLNRGVILQACDTAKVDLGNNVIISYGTKILTGNLSQTFLNNVTQRTHNSSSVSIGNNVWIGANVIILPGVSIANNSIIAAGTVVTKSIDTENGIFAGVPAKKIKDII
ncbi:acyltransferase [Salinimicrobium tongyeongense]|uniref:Acyltransferase n=1 Tax=Salinimicrobium tongyeongense TaxID=2809707 RepID=A0ABY6NP25_9FLAO|nr:acyltransferase [Salinimicrobium tongyeongense]UZH54650.1 acyltransferase [Salinimicrobium tongyeongense]